MLTDCRSRARLRKTLARLPPKPSKCSARSPTPTRTLRPYSSSGAIRTRQSRSESILPCRVNPPIRR